MYKTRPMIVINFSGSKANAHALNLTWTTYIYTNITHRESMIICMVPPPLRHRRRAVEAAWKRKLPQTVWHVAARRRNFECDCWCSILLSMLTVVTCHFRFTNPAVLQKFVMCIMLIAVGYIHFAAGGGSASSRLLLQQRARLDNKHY